MTDRAAFVLFLVALAAIFAALILRADSVGEPAPPQMTIEDAEVVPYVP